MISKAELEQRRRELDDFNRWERSQLPRPMTAEECMAALGALYEWLPESTRAEERDPERLGVRRMQEILRLARPK